MPRAARYSKLLLKAMRGDANGIATVPLNMQKISGQTANFHEIYDTDGTTLLFARGPAGEEIAGPAGVSKTYHTVVSISAADIVDTAAGKLGHASGQTLVADPGAGKVIELVGAVMSFTYGVAAYTGGGNVTINSNGGSALTGLVSAANSLGASADKIVSFLPLAAAGNALTANKGLMLVAASAFTQPGTATGTVKVFLTYRVHTL